MKRHPHGEDARPTERIPISAPPPVAPTARFPAVDPAPNPPDEPVAAGPPGRPDRPGPRHARRDIDWRRVLLVATVTFVITCYILVIVGLWLLVMDLVTILSVLMSLAAVPT